MIVPFVDIGGMPMGFFHLGVKKTYQLGEDFFIYHISFGRIILIHFVPLSLARQMSVAACSRGGGSRILNKIFILWKCHSSFIKTLRLKSYIKHIYISVLAEYLYPMRFQICWRAISPFIYFWNCSMEKSVFSFSSLLIAATT